MSLEIRTSLSEVSDSVERRDLGNTPQRLGNYHKMMSVGGFEELGEESSQVTKVPGEPDRPRTLLGVKLSQECRHRQSVQ